MNKRPFKSGYGWLVALWIATAMAGHLCLLRYSLSAGPKASGTKILPPLLAGTRGKPLPQLYLALHPRCPCSRATVAELAKIQTRAAGAAEVIVLVFKPDDQPDSWSASELVDRCRRMQCQIRLDPDGRTAEALGLLTSGDMALYDTEDKLRFHGGITGARGHEGDNPGETALIEILRGHDVARAAHPVFGCPIQSETAAPNTP